MSDYHEPTLMELLFYRVLTGQVLSDIDIKSCSNMFFTMALDIGISKGDVEIKINKFRKSIPNFLLAFEKELLEFKRINSQTRLMFEEELKFKASLPPLADRFDAPEMISFIRSLKSELYNFSTAAKFLGITRQTLKDYAVKKLHGFKQEKKGNSMHVSKVDMINFYREKNFKNYNPFLLLK